MPQVFPQNRDPDGKSSVTGLVHSVESCGTVDGPGIRFVLFLSGCSLRCRYCHNPDTSYVRRGRLRSADDVLKEIARYRDFLQAAGGGVTLSGGDPLFQPDFAGAVLKGCRKLGLHTCLDTSGHLGVNAGEEMLADTDLVLLDIKAWNPKRYRALTGGELRPTLEFAERLASLRKPVWLRYVLVPGVTDNLEEIEELSRHAALLGNVERVDVLSAAQMYDATTRAFEGADGAVMCAAVADYTPDTVSQTKLKKGEGEMHITLRRTRDIAAELGASKGGRLLVGFALETHDEQANAEAKLARKNFDFIVLNSLRDAGAGFRGDTNKVTFIDRKPLPLMPKSEVAGRIVDKIESLLK